MTTTSPKTSILIGAWMLALAPAAALIFLSPAAAAQTPETSMTVQVGVADIRIEDPASLRVAQARFEAAARTLCAETTVHSPLEPRAESACRRTAVTQAMAQLTGRRADFAIASAD